MKETEILIIGAGPTGMVMSLALTKYGIQNIILERTNEIQKHPKAHEISGRTLEIIHSLGVSLKELVKEASDQETASKITFCKTIRSPFGSIDLQEPSIGKKYEGTYSISPPYLNISQTELETILRSHLSQKKSSTLALNMEWISSEEDSDGIVSCVKDLKTQELFQIRSQYLIACDGANSAVRNHLSIEMLGPKKLQDVVNVFFTDDLSNDLQIPAKLNWIFDARFPGVLIAHHPKKRWVYHHPIDLSWDRLENYDKAFFQKTLRTIIEKPDDYQFSISSIKHWQMSAQIAKTFFKNRIFLLGDAAHRFPPTGGLGLNSGVIDACNLSWKLKFVLHRNVSTSLLSTYELERKPVVRKNALESVKNWKRLLSIPKALGISLSLGIYLKRLIHAKILLVCFNHKRKQAFMDQIAYWANRKIESSLKDSRKKAKIKNAIQAQIPHFDRLNLDITYSYAKQTQGLVGRRFPHFFIGDRSSHSYLDSESIQAFVFGDNESNQILKSEMLLMGIPLTVHKVPNIDSPMQDLSIPKYGCVLVRPDGHVYAVQEDRNTSMTRGEFFSECIQRLMEGNAIWEDAIQKTKQRKQKMFIPAIISISLLCIALGLFSLMRPIDNPPKPANFDLVELSEGKLVDWYPSPKRIYGLGLVYAKHIEETASEYDPEIPPPIFEKELQSLAENKAEIPIPTNQDLVQSLVAFDPSVQAETIHAINNFSPLLDYEVELGFVLLEDVQIESLQSDLYSPKIAFFLANDVSARSLAIFGEGQKNRIAFWGLSKSFPKFLPVSDQIWIPKEWKPNLLPNLRLKTFVNGEERQNELVSNMIYTPKEMLRFIHKQYPDRKLEKNDMVIMGTPGGVAMQTSRIWIRFFDFLGIERNSKLKLALKKQRNRFLKDGDMVEMDGEGLGKLENKFIEKVGI
ncbi:hypothetical protein LPTSP4_25980 [Leptospira ryugenii]|uniref:FAD binding domain protein n=1 Tax=Leptospira ryugenii TaxID=1917863 RepID=A0A2P2E2F9_9LEPT|nr:FAD-dependent monooxygenase [Leptospira ryugenii]GBF51067.1 hypothetical protein LPTSP4_25980 [Leptospira ryugenii]